MVDIKGTPPSLADKAKTAAKGRNVQRAKRTGDQNRDGQPPVRLATPAEEDKIKRDQHKGDTTNKARDENEIGRCITNKDLETHTRLATPAEEKEIKAKHAKKRAEAAGQAMPPLSAKQQQAEADEAAASVARRQALGGV